MANDDFIVECFKLFKFLETDYQFKVTAPKVDSFGVELVYKSKTVGITVRFEPREDFVFVILHKLIEGKMPEEPVFITEDTKLNSFYVHDLFKGRKVEDKYIAQINKGKRTPEPISIKNTLEAYVYVLKMYFSDILEGEICRFSELESHVKEKKRS